MTKRLITLCGAIALLGCACNESGKFSEYYKACSPESFSPTCPTSKIYTACMDNKVVAMSCSEDEICLNGTCRKDTAGECVQSDFTSSCANDSYKYICNAQNKIDQELCPAGTVCKGGNCVTDDSCVADGFKSACADDSHYTVCRDNKIATESCGKDTKCQGGNCVTDDSCVVDTFESECTDESHHTICHDGVRETEACPADTKCQGGNCITDNDNSCEANTIESECTDDTH